MTGATHILGAFVTPTLFFGGAVAVAAPIIIHLLARRRFKRVRWAAMDFLLHAERKNRRRIRMEEWILLALRCLAVLLLALMVARPFIKPSSGAVLFGGARRTERVFVLDDSLSMAYEGAAASTPFARAKVAVRRLLTSIRAETPDDTVTLLRMSAPKAPVESGTFLDDAQTDDLLARLDAMTPTQRAIDASTVVDGVAELLDQSPDITSVAIYFISDFQRHDWIRVDTGSTAADAGLFDPLDAWRGDDRGLHVVLVDVSEDNPTNRAITDLSLTGGQLVVGTTGQLRAKIVNFSQQAVEHLELRVSVANVDQPVGSVRQIAAQQSATVDLRAEFVRAGVDAVRFEIPPDGLAADNVRHLTADVASAIRIAVVNGEPSTDSYDDEVTFLTTALRPEGEMFSGNEVVVLDETELEQINLTTFHLVVLANVYRLSDPAVEALERYTTRGGGVLIFLGDQVDADLYNAALYREGEGLLPGELTEIVSSAGGAHLVVTDRLHPAMRGLSGEGDPLGIGQIPFLEYFGCVPHEGVPGDESIPAAARRSARVVARFDDADENPAIVERAFGRGRVLLVTTAVDKEWHQWPDHPTFLPIVMELARYVTRGANTDVQTLVGESIELSFDPALFEPDAIVRTPAYPNERELGVTAAPAPDGRGMVLSWEHSEQAGMYRFLLRRRDGGEEIRMVAVNIDPRESDLTAALEDELRRTAGDVPVKYIKGLDALVGSSGEARTEVWRLMLVIAVCVLMMEQLLAFWWGRRS